MTPLLLVAEQAPSAWTAGNVLIAIVSLAAASALVGGLGMIIARGFWSKTIEPMIQAAFVTWYTSEEQLKTRKIFAEQTFQAWHGSQPQIDARNAEIVRVAQAWHTAPEQTKVRKDFVREEIDNHVRRDDGIIHKEIKVSVESGIGPLKADMAEIKGMLHDRQREDLSFREAVIGKLGHLEGLLQTSPDRAEAAVPGLPRAIFPPAPKPKPPTPAR